MGKQDGNKRIFWQLRKRFQMVDPFKFIIDLVTLVTLIVTIVTLREDIVTRNSSYMPFFKVVSGAENNLFKLSWNINEESTPELDLPELSFSLYNIGNGIADDVTVEFDQDVLKKWIEQLKIMGADVDYETLEDEKGLRRSFPWIVNDPDSPVTISVPSAYLRCLRELYRWKEITDCEPFELPVIKFTIIYKDIQGKVVTYGYSYNDFFNEIGVSKGKNGEREKIITWEISAGKKIQ